MMVPHADTKFGFIPPKPVSAKSTLATSTRSLPPPECALPSSALSPVNSTKELLRSLSDSRTGEGWLTDWPESVATDLEAGWGEDTQSTLKLGNEEGKQAQQGIITQRQDSLIDLEDQKDEEDPEQAPQPTDNQAEASSEQSSRHPTSSNTLPDNIATGDTSASDVPNHYSNPTSSPENNSPDSAKRKRPSKSQSTSVAKRKNGEEIVYNVRILRESDGKKRNQNVQWSEAGPHTIVGVFQEIVCKLCQGRVHWACASLEPNADMTEDKWYCPSCDYLRQKARKLRIATAQQERCIRPDCVLRSHKELIFQEGDESRFIPEKIIGQREVKRHNGKRLLEYLVFWESWPLCDATWETKDCFTNFPAICAVFELEARKELKDTRTPGVILLDEAKSDWTGDGKLKTQRSKKWRANAWPDDCGL